MIELRDVWYRYPGGPWAISGVNLRFEGRHVLVGPNGSGKTTLLKVSSLIYRPTRGKVLVNGVDFWGLDGRRRRELRRQVVYVHERPILIRGTVLDNLAYPLIMRGYSREEALKIGREALSTINAEHLAEKRRKELSTGEAQLISVLRALILRPKVLMLDEPTAHLDFDRREVLLNLLKGVEVLIVATHDPLLVEELGGSLIRMSGGRAEYEGAHDLSKGFWRRGNS